jgi:hypothetical protein
MFESPFQMTFGKGRPGVQRTDQGKDYAGYGPIYAIDDGIVQTVSSSSGWPGGGWIGITLTSGERAGWTYYVAENITPKVGKGRVKKGQLIAMMHGGIEMGWVATPTMGDKTAMNALTSQMGQNAKQLGISSDPGAVPSFWGKDFASFMSTGTKMTGTLLSVKVLDPATILKQIRAAADPAADNQLQKALGDELSFEKQIRNAMKYAVGARKKAFAQALKEAQRDVARLRKEIQDAKWIAGGVSEVAREKQAGKLELALDEELSLVKAIKYAESRAGPKRKAALQAEAKIVAGDINKLRAMIADKVATTELAKQDKGLKTLEGQIAAQISAYDKLKSGQKMGKDDLLGIAILVPYQPSVDDWLTVLNGLELKLQAARERRGVLNKALAKAKRAKYPNKKLIAGLIARIAALQQQINNLLQDIFDARQTIKDLVDAGATITQKDAGELEKMGVITPDDVSKGAQAAADAAAAAAGDTGGAASGDTGGTGSTGGPTDTGQSMADARAQAQAALQSFLGQLKDLETNYEGNILAPYSQFMAGMHGAVFVMNHFKMMPPDPHVWSKNLQFELAAVGSVR